MDLMRLISLLSQHGVRLSLWGVGKAKAVDELAKELELGEAKLTPRKGEVLVGDSRKMVLRRKIVTVTCQITVELNRHVYALVEKYQILPDKTKKKRRHPENSISEKVRCLGVRRLNPESVLEALLRAFADELEIEDLEPEDLISLIFYAVEPDGPRLSDSFPDIEVENTLHRSFWKMPLRKKDGRLLFFRRHYVEYHKDGREIHFGWKRIATIQKPK